MKKNGILALNRYLAELNRCEDESAARRLLTKAKCDYTLKTDNLRTFESMVERFIVNKRLVAYER